MPACSTCERGGTDHGAPPNTHTHAHVCHISVSLPLPFPYTCSDHLELFRRNGFDFLERQPDGRLAPLPQPQQAPSAAAAASDAAAPGDPANGAASSSPPKQQQPGALGDPGDDASELVPLQAIANDDIVMADDSCAMDGSSSGTFGWGAGELLLSAVPVSGSTFQLGPEDVAELVALVKAGGASHGFGATAAAGGDGTSGPTRAWEDELRPSRWAGARRSNCNLDAPGCLGWAVRWWTHSSCEYGIWYT